MAKLVTKTYADAMFALAMEENRLDEFEEASQKMLFVLGENEVFLELMSQPDISDAKKEQIIEEVFGDRIPKELVGMLVLLVKKGHTAEIQAVFDYFIRLVRQEKKIGKADVTTAFALSDEKKQTILNRLLELTPYESIEMNCTVDKELIGGMVIRIGDRRIDTSIRTRLYELSRDLRKIQV